MESLTTRWGRELDPSAVLPEYPRPQLVRDSYLNLNGWWDYAVTPADAGPPEVWDGRILVPFSPEAPLSGVGRQLLPDQRLWYRRDLVLPDDFHPDGNRLLLHFGAVDQECRVWCDDVEVGGHTGGYLPFHCDLTAALRPAGSRLVVAVRDLTDTGDHSRGKQRLDRGGIWYTAQSGIWQTVWAESVPSQYIRGVTMTPRLDEDAVEVTVDVSDDAPGGTDPGPATARVEIRAGDARVTTADLVPGSPATLAIPDPRLWTPEDPYRYDVTVQYGDDRVESYLGMRSFGVGPNASGTPRLLLNGRPYFHAGVLDQGYWPDGLYTAPSDAAMIHDIATMKRLGFTMLRKHIKIEPLRWYHHCDRLGMLVWQDLVNGGRIDAPEPAPSEPLGDRVDDHDYHRFGRADPQGRQQFRTEMRDTVDLLRNVVSLALWVPFNEGWGQFDAARIAAELSELDATRPVDHASGWHDQGAGDLTSRHVYTPGFRLPVDDSGRVAALTEYGGHQWRADGHVFGTESFGYHGHDTAEQLADAFIALHRDEIVPAITAGLSATVYTQLTDVEDELNGLLTYDRDVLKIPEEIIQAVTERLRFR